MNKQQLQQVLQEVYEFKNIDAFTFEELQNIYTNSSDFKKRVMAPYINKLIKGA